MGKSMYNVQVCTMYKSMYTVNHMAADTQYIVYIPIPLSIKDTIFQKHKKQFSSKCHEISTEVHKSNVPAI